MTTTPMGLASVPEPEVPARAQRRQYGARCNARTLGEYERLESIERGALLRREGLYSSHISKWRKQRDDGALAALAMPVGRPTAHPLDKEVAWLKRENAQLQADLTTAGSRRMSYGGVPFWKLPLSLWDDLHSVSLRSHYIASRFAAPLMIAQGHGLIVNISSAGEARFMFNVPYSVGNAGVARLTQDTARELQPHGVAVVALWPGLTRTELVMANPHLAQLAERVGRSPQLTGRAVAALAADPAIIDKTGQSIDVRDVALAYGFTDLDGTLPPPR